MVVAYARSYAEGSNNEEEALALLCGMRITRARRINRLVIEGDFMLIINVVKGEGMCSWNITVTIEEIHSLLNGLLEVHMDHFYQEGNRVVNDLPKVGHKVEGIKE